MANTFLVTAMLFLALSRALTVDATRNPSFLQSGVNGGTSCAVCAVVIGLAEQLTEVYNISVSEALSRFCSFLPSGFQEGCDALVDEFGPIVIELLENKETPDVVCQAIDLCKKDTEEVCHLFPLSQHSDRPGELNERIHRARQLAASIRKAPLTLGECTVSSLFFLQRGWEKGRLPQVAFQNGMHCLLQTERLCIPQNDHDHLAN